MTTGERRVPSWVKVGGALRHCAIEASQIEGAGRVPHVLSALALVVQRAYEEGRPEILRDGVAALERLRHGHEDASPGHALGETLAEAHAILTEHAAAAVAARLG